MASGSALLGRGARGFGCGLRDGDDRREPRASEEEERIMVSFIRIAKLRIDKKCFVPDVTGYEGSVRSTRRICGGDLQSLLYDNRWGERNT